MSANGHHKPLDDLARTLLSPKFIGGLFKLISFVVRTLLTGLSTVAVVLGNTRLGARGCAWYWALLVAFALFGLANEAQNIAGDMLFLLAAVFSVKWAAEWAWARRRQSAGSFEHSESLGIPLTAALGINSLAAPFVVIMVLGMFVSISPPGRLAGPVLFLSGATHLLMMALAGTLLAAAATREQDQAVAAHYEDMRSNVRQTPPERFHDVDIN